MNRLDQERKESGSETERSVATGRKGAVKKERERRAAPGLEDEDERKGKRVKPG
jgi:hypothetical protein